MSNKITKVETITIKTYCDFDDFLDKCSKAEKQLKEKNYSNIRVESRSMELFVF